MHVKSPPPTRSLYRLGRMVLAAVLVCGLGSFAGNAHAGHAALVLDGSTGDVLSAINPDEINHPASLTKMMTLYLTFQALESGQLKLDQQLPVSAWAAARRRPNSACAPARPSRCRTAFWHDYQLGQ
jgi:D-alanyl-D-alanine carboxypeptidase